MEVPTWDPSSPEYSRQEQNMFEYRRHIVSPTTPARGQIFINSLTLYAYVVADVMDDDNYTTVLESFVNTSLLQVTQVNTKKVLGSTICFLSERGVFHPKKHLK